MTITPNAKKISDLLMVELIESAVAGIILGIIGYLIGTLFGWRDDLKAIAAAAALLIGLLLAVLVFRFTRSYPDKLGQRYMSERTGIVLTFPNLEACKQDMMGEFKRAKDVRLLLQIGRRELGDSEASYFYSLTKDKNIPGSTMKILRASDQSPFLSKDRATARNADYMRWQKDIERLGSEIYILGKISKVKIEERQHSEPYLWRIFIFDKVAYVSAYLFPSDVDSRCVVYKLLEGENSLYSVYKKYFDYLWAKYDPDDAREPNERWAKWE